MHNINTDIVLESQQGMMKPWFGKRHCSMFLSVGIPGKCNWEILSTVVVYFTFEFGLHVVGLVIYLFFN